MHIKKTFLCRLLYVPVLFTEMLSMFLAQARRLQTTLLKSLQAFSNDRKAKLVKLYMIMKNRLKFLAIHII